MTPQHPCDPILGIDATATDCLRQHWPHEAVLCAVAEMPPGGTRDVTLGACGRAIVLGADGRIEAIVLYDQPLDFRLVGEEQLIA